MTDTIIKGTGNSRSIKSVPNFATLFPTWESYRDAMGTDGVPIDIGPLNLAGLLQKGTDLNKANLLTDETAALIGFDISATVNDVLYALGLYTASGGKAAKITVKDPDGNPIEGVKLSGTTDPYGNAAVTDENGVVFVKLSSSTSISFSSKYIDLSNVTKTFSPNANAIVTNGDVTLPWATGDIIITTSGEYAVQKNHDAVVCAVGGGQNGSSGNSGNSYSTNSRASGGSGGSGGKISNATMSLKKGAIYEALIAAAGSAQNSTFGTLSSESGTVNTVPLNDDTLKNRYGGNGANGGSGGTPSSSAPNGLSGSSSSSSGGGGGGGGGGHIYIDGKTPGGGGSGGTSAHGYSGSSGATFSGSVAGAGGRGGNGGYGGGGGGGGGGGSAGNNAIGSGGAGGTGGQGIILVKFLD